MSSCFISDLHLDHKREDIKKAFFKFLESEASEFENLYILGDLFEVWIGDDFEDRFTSEVISELKKFSLKNKNIFIMHGNRDFLIGKKFAEKCGAKLISDPLILNKEGKKIMLSHGDIFCTDDLEYQNFKEKVRNEKWQKEFLSKDLKDREEIAKNLRKESTKKNSKKEYLNRDEVNEMIESAIRRHNRRSTIISSVLGWILIGGYSFGLFQAVQNV